MLEGVDPERLTPIEALNILMKLKKLTGEGEEDVS
jgi:hypothetical protein